MPFVGTGASGNDRIAKAQAGITRTWTTAGPGLEAVRGYPLRVLGMNNLLVSVTQTAGAVFATVQVRAALTNFPDPSTDAGFPLVLASQTIVALNQPLIFTVSPLVANHVTVVISTDGATAGNYTIGASA
jgi:hypothetical protein